MHYKPLSNIHIHAEASEVAPYFHISNVSLSALNTQRDNKNEDGGGAGVALKEKVWDDFSVVLFTYKIPPQLNLRFFFASTSTHMNC